MQKIRLFLWGMGAVVFSVFLCWICDKSPFAFVAGIALAIAVGIVFIGLALIGLWFFYCTLFAPQERPEWGARR